MLLALCHCGGKIAIKDQHWKSYACCQLSWEYSIRSWCWRTRLSMDLCIRVVDGKFVTGNYHKVDDFNFELITCTFHKAIFIPCWVIRLFIYKSFVSLDFVITSMISCFGKNVGIPSWSNVVICIASCLYISKDYVWTTKKEKNKAK